MAMFEWLNEEMDLHTTTNRGYKKVPVIWVSAEQAYQSKRSKEMRDKEGALILPLLSSNAQDLRRIKAVKALLGQTFPETITSKAVFTITRQIKQNGTANFANADAKKKKGKSTSQQRTVYMRQFLFNSPFLSTLVCSKD